MNLDTMEFEELDALWRGISDTPTECADLLFSDKPEGYVEVAQQLALYARERINAMQYRAGGHIEDALKIEHKMQRVYNNLPDYAKW